VEPSLSVVRYFLGMGGTLLLIELVLVVLFVAHIRVYDTANRYYETIAMAYIGTMLGLTLLFVTVPTLCFLRSTLMCYRVM